MSDRAGYQFDTGTIPRVSAATGAGVQVVAAGPLIDPATRTGSVAKFLVPFATAALTAVAVLLAGPVSTNAVLTCAIAVATAAGVYVVPHLGASAASYGKVAVAVLGAGAQYALGVTSGGVSSQEWVLIILAGLAAVGVAAVPNAAALPASAARHLGR